MLTLLLDFLGFLFWTITLLLPCLLLIVIPYYEWPLKHIKCHVQVDMYMCISFKSPSKLMQPVQSCR